MQSARALLLFLKSSSGQVPASRQAAVLARSISFLAMLSARLDSASLSLGAVRGPEVTLPGQFFSTTHSLQSDHSDTLQSEQNICNNMKWVGPGIGGSLGVVC